jgi:hypothetical protein
MITMFLALFTRVVLRPLWRSQGNPQTVLGYITVTLCLVVSDVTYAYKSCKTNCCVDYKVARYRSRLRSIPSNGSVISDSVRAPPDMSAAPIVKI